MSKDLKKVEAGRALASKVSPDYYRFIGRMGGKQFMFNYYSRLAREYDVRESIEWEYSPSFSQWSTAQIEKFNAWRREMFAEIAEGYRQETGTRIMLLCFDTRDDQPSKRRRKKRPLLKLVKK
jgi:hypothetical protein